MFFWPEINTLGPFQNFDNERMFSLNTKVPPLDFTSIVFFLYRNLPCSLGDLQADIPRKEPDSDERMAS